MDAEGGLAALLRRGPTPRYAVRSVVFAHWHEVEAARRLPCTWREIALALGLREDQWRSVYRAYRKILRDFNGPPPKVKESTSLVSGSKNLKNLKIDI